ncbi:unnamed protein product, partial [Brachionus calyciflorus]
FAPDVKFKRSENSILFPNALISQKLTLVLKLEFVKSISCDKVKGLHNSLVTFEGGTSKFNLPFTGFDKLDLNFELYDSVSILGGETEDGFIVSKIFLQSLSVDGFGDWTVVDKFEFDVIFDDDKVGFE